MSAAIFLDPHSFSIDALESAGQLAGDRLDVVLTSLPLEFYAREHIIRRAYELALKFCASTDVTVVPELNQHKWSRVFVTQDLDLDHATVGSATTLPAGEPIDISSGSRCPDKSTQFPVAAVGGTFDHLHYGHKLLLTLSALACTSKLIVGITGQELLQNKKYAGALEPYNVRNSKVRSFISGIAPSLKVFIHEIRDIYGPTGTDRDIDALVVSKETSAGADQVNQLRREKGWNELHVLEVGLIAGDIGEEKLSSTDLRRKALEKKALI